MGRENSDKAILDLSRSDILKLEALALGKMQISQRMKHFLWDFPHQIQQICPMLVCVCVCVRREVHKSKDIENYFSMKILIISLFFFSSLLNA